MFGNTGSTLSDLARNQILADQLLGNELANADLRTLERERQRRQDQQQLNQLALQRDALNQDYGYRNNALAQQGRIADMQWNTPNATQGQQFALQREISQLPWTQGMTPAEQAHNELLRAQMENQYKISKMPYESMSQGGLPPGMANSKAGQAFAEAQIDQSMRPYRLKRAMDAANAQYRIRQGQFTPLTTDRGQALSIIQELQSQYPEVSELAFDRARGFTLPEVAQQPAANPFQLIAPQRSTNSVANPFQTSTNRVVIQNGMRFQINPDGSSTYLGPAQ
jgi:hypothetical protein